MMGFTLYALFFDDLRIIFLGKDEDDIVYGFTIFVMLLFGLEIVLNSIVDPSYINSFFFWLDIISTISMFFDIGWITNS